ncbi:short transient receptor potential channel 4-like isoform X2 [Ptychodera flava]|uniref:short transient receptor potential channel 4-like isoform X2 n=1 Tax=Ptychodera flava TaxID=63121 RepID=UPI00396A5F1A
MSSTKSSFERVYLSAARKGDIHALEKVLNKATEADDINVKTSKGRTALELAVENGRLDVIQVLLQHGVEIGDALLLAVEAKFFKAVQAILELPQLLMEKGAPPIEISEYNTEKHTVQRSVGTLNIYKALASEAYISYIETEKKERSDPFGRAFELAVELRTLSSTEYEFRQEYSDLAEKCEQFAADLLGQTREAEELRTVLNHDSYQGIAADDSRTKDLPAKVIYAVKTDQKKFVAHPYCQQELIERWYSGLADWRDRNAIRNFLLSILIMIFYPILCLIYLIVPVGKFRRFMRTPYIKFLTHTASYFYFLFILIMMTQDFRSYGERSELGKLWMRQMQHQERGPLPSLFEYLLIIWVAGMLWREMKELWSTGFRQYFSDAWNFIDFIQLGLYLSWMGIRTAAFIRVNQERDAFSDFSREDYTTVTTKPLSDTSETNTPLVTDSPFHSVSPTFGSDENSTAAILRHIWASVQYDQQCVANISRLLDSLINQVLLRTSTDRGVPVGRPYCRRQSQQI